MADNKEKSGGWMSVPAFGDWDMKQGVPDYSLDFSKIREARKVNKSDFSRVSVGNEDELISSQRSSEDHRVSDHRRPLANHHHDHHSPTTRRTIMSYFNCCVRA